MSNLPVTDVISNRNEHLVEAVKAIGRLGGLKHKVFEAIYYHKKRIKTVDEIAEMTGLSRMQVLQSAGSLKKAGIIKQDRKDGDTAYVQIESFQHLKPQIMSLLRTPQKLKNIATKRGPTVAQASVAAVKKRELKRRKKLNILFLTATPDQSNPLRLDVEIRRVQEAIRGSKFRDNVNIAYRPAADVGAILDGLNDYSPQIVHFSGHGDKDGIFVDNGSVSDPSADQLTYSLLAKALQATDRRPSVVVLNACWSGSAKNHILTDIPFLIAMRVPISDVAAVTFAQRFYAAIASGQSVQAAFDQARLAVEFSSISEVATPELFSSGRDPSKIILT